MSRTPLLFWDVDTQVDFMMPSGKLYVPDAEQIIPALERLSEAADRHGVPVVASADDHEPGDAELSDDPDYETTYPPHCLRGTPGVKRIPATEQDWTHEIGHARLADGELARAARAEGARILIHKKRFDVFTNPNTEPLIRAIGPERIVIYGVALDVCNKAAVEGMLERGFHGLTVVTDATRPISTERAEGLLDAWKARGVELATTEQVLAGLREPANVT